MIVQPADFLVPVNVRSPGMVGVLFGKVLML